MSSIPSPRFYVYALARPIKKDWQIFYIGKGSKRRVFAHESEAKRGHKCHKCNIIRKVLREGGEIQRYILLTTDNEQEALDYEKEMIALHGRDNLCNHTDGGEGTTGLVMPMSARKQISIRNYQRYQDPIQRAKARDAMNKRYQDPGQRAKARDRMSKQWQDPEYRARQNEFRQNQWNNPERRTMHSEKVRVHWKDPAFHAACVAERKSRWEDPAYREKHTSINRKMWEDPAQHVAASIERKSRWADPEYKERVKKSMRERWADPESKVKILAARKQARENKKVKE